jgi:hypothetical protein
MIGLYVLILGNVFFICFSYYPFSLINGELLTSVLLVSNIVFTRSSALLVSLMQRLFGGGSSIGTALFKNMLCTVFANVQKIHSFQLGMDCIIVK